MALVTGDAGSARGVEGLGLLSFAVAANDLKLEPSRVFVVADDLDHRRLGLVAEKQAVLQAEPRVARGDADRLGVGRDDDARRSKIVRLVGKTLKRAANGNQDFS